MNTGTLYESMAKCNKWVISMKRIYFIFIVSILMIVGSIYRLWAIEQSRVGPIGDGSVSIWFYISIYSSLIAGVFGILSGVLRLVHIQRNKDKEILNEKDE